MKGAQSKVVNASCSGPRVCDEALFNAHLEPLRNELSKKHFHLTSLVMRRVLSEMMVSIGRADVVNLNPIHDFASQLDAVMT